MKKLHGTIVNYAWGSHSAIPRILGRPEDGRPQAEYWLGAHRSAPSLLADEPLDAYLSAHPATIGDRSVKLFGAQLPYLMKVLAARQALSIQAHPARWQAEEGYAREESAGIPRNAKERTYKDSWPKPEILIALDDFHILHGFRDPHQTHDLFTQLGVAELLEPLISPLVERKGSAALAEVFLDVLSLDESRVHLVNEVSAAAVKHVDAPGALGEFARTAVELDEFYPGDRGILGALLMNRVTLRPGEAVFTPSGVMHAYLYGTGIEVMANSDNVIRGGLTPKHIDVEAMVAVVDFSPAQPRVVEGKLVRPGIYRYDAECAEFDVWRLALNPGLGAARLPGASTGRILFVTGGYLQLHCGDDTLDLRQGEAAFLEAGAGRVYATGDADAFLSGPGAH